MTNALDFVAPPEHTRAEDNHVCDLVCFDNVVTLIVGQKSSHDDPPSIAWLDRSS